MPRRHRHQLGRSPQILDHVRAMGIQSNSVEYISAMDIDKNLAVLSGGDPTATAAFRNLSHSLFANPEVRNESEYRTPAQAKKAKRILRCVFDEASMTVDGTTVKCVDKQYRNDLYESPFTHSETGMLRMIVANGFCYFQVLPEDESDDSTDDDDDDDDDDSVDDYGDERVYSDSADSSSSSSSSSSSEDNEQTENRHRAAFLASSMPSLNPQTRTPVSMDLAARDTFKRKHHRHLSSAARKRSKHHHATTGSSDSDSDDDSDSDNDSPRKSKHRHHRAASSERNISNKLMQGPQFFGNASDNESDYSDSMMARDVNRSRLVANGKMKKPSSSQRPSKTSGAFRTVRSRAIEEHKTSRCSHPEQCIDRLLKWRKKRVIPFIPPAHTVDVYIVRNLDQREEWYAVNRSTGQIMENVYFYVETPPGKNGQIRSPVSGIAQLIHYHKMLMAHFSLSVSARAIPMAWIGDQNARPLGVKFDTSKPLDGGKGSKTTPPHLEEAKKRTEELKRKHQDLFTYIQKQNENRETRQTGMARKLQAEAEARGESNINSQTSLTQLLALQELAKITSYQSENVTSHLEHVTFPAFASLPSEVMSAVRYCHTKTATAIGVPLGVFEPGSADHSERAEQQNARLAYIQSVKQTAAVVNRLTSYVLRICMSEMANTFECVLRDSVYGLKFYLRTPLITTDEAKDLMYDGLMHPEQVVRHVANDYSLDTNDLRYEAASAMYDRIEKGEQAGPNEQTAGLAKKGSTGSHSGSSGSKKKKKKKTSQSRKSATTAGSIHKRGNARVKKQDSRT